MSKLEVFFDCSSPWTYLAITQVGGIARAHGAELIWRPILVGGIFNQINKEVYETRANPDHPKYRYMRKDLMNWADYRGVTINWPTIFPVNSVKAMRACIAAADIGKCETLALEVCDAYWGRNQDIAQDEVVAACAEAVGLDAAAILEKTNDPEIKQRLKNHTQEVMDRQGFGSPTMYVNETDMFFGQDRLVLVEEALKRAA
ncbi:MAG: 2-hydroxychromene-2-carboxylate isomerase [Minwuia sp.]|uniref:2-hydroxychromene-2-carboxylate isomerase n=1 Tax=Minwuia sp. TaxID=2493630 RepID=UPI003A8B3E44